MSSCQLLAILEPCVCSVAELFFSSALTPVCFHGKCPRVQEVYAAFCPKQVRTMLLLMALWLLFSAGVRLAPFGVWLRGEILLKP